MRFLHTRDAGLACCGQDSDKPTAPHTEEGDATGFMVAPGLLMTNWHVLEDRGFRRGCINHL